MSTKMYQAKDREATKRRTRGRGTGAIKRRGGMGGIGVLLLGSTSTGPSMFMKKDPPNKIILPPSRHLEETARTVSESIRVAFSQSISQAGR